VSGFRRPFAAIFLADRFCAFMASLSRTVANCVVTVGTLVSLLLTGCDSPPAKFAANDLYATVVAKRQSTVAGSAASDVAEVVERLFGTPDQPRVPVGFPVGLIDPENLARAAGPVSSDREDTHFGIYRARCVVCHGVDGGGTGPAAALQSPYPRDFRSGVFKFKSTLRGMKPTKDDLLGVLRQGAAGTGMPSFARLPEEDLAALVDYVIYLAIRGETERRLIQWAITDLGYGDVDLPPTDQERLRVDERGRFASQQLGDEVAAMVSGVAQSWRDAVPIAVAPREGMDTTTRLAAIERGKSLFHGPLANCASCHGTEGSGNAVTLDFDDWTKEYTTMLGIAPADRAQVKPMRQVGALRPRPISPRNLSWGVYRGGSDPETLYRRLVAGIEGTPMPGLLVNQSDESTANVGVTPAQVWDLVAYLESLGEASIAGVQP